MAEKKIPDKIEDEHLREIYRTVSGGVDREDIPEPFRLTDDILEEGLRHFLRRNPFPFGMRRDVNIKKR